MGLLVSCRSLDTSEKKVVHISRHESSSELVKQEVSRPYISSYGVIAMDDHKNVEKWITYFQTKGREYMEKYLSRSTRYIPMMKQVLREYRLPENLVYVVMIESGFNPKARSFAGAVGYWQFIEATARRYGLKVNSYIDERRDPVLSTRAAAEYFKDLYGIFGSWHLALASYNAGEYRVNRFVMRHYTRDFWYLSARRAFPSETRNYVPKFIAAFRIATNPAKYGFSSIEYEKQMEYDTVPLVFPISLKKLSKRLSIEYSDLQNLNPRYRGEYVPVNKSGEGSYIRVPVGLKVQVDSVIAQCRMKKPKYVADYYWYRVRRGDSLYRLARRNRTKVSIIRRMNRMKSRTMLRAGRRIKLPYYSRSGRGKRKKGSYVLAQSHIVRRGESLNSIARRYKVSISGLRKINGLSGAVIHPGQRLRLVDKGVKLAKNQLWHVVKRGETLIGIAKEYNVALPTLMKLNALNFKSILTVGRRIIIPKKGGSGSGSSKRGIK